MNNEFVKNSVCIIGGAGHIGLPLGVAFANAGFDTTLLDINTDNLSKIKQGIFPFKEENGEAELKAALAGQRLKTTNNPSAVAESEFIVLVIGTRSDEYLNPNLGAVLRVISEHRPFWRDGQTLILRSTVYPGTSERVQGFFAKEKKNAGVAYCPERIAEGRALTELRQIAQIVSAFDPATLQKARNLFAKITEKIVVVQKPIEAELAKLFSNAWRYVSFAVANQFYAIAAEAGLDYRAIHEAMTQDYPRNAALPKPGFAAGPCLLKDTMQLAAFNLNNFYLGHSAMLINEGLPAFLLKKLKEKHELNHRLDDKTLGILGMAFKAESDDSRDSLSYKLRRLAQTEFAAVLCHDAYIQDASFATLPELLEKSDVIILATAHQAYKNINPRQYPEKIFVDIWGFWKQEKE